MGSTRLIVILNFLLLHGVIRLSAKDSYYKDTSFRIFYLKLVAPSTLTISLQFKVQLLSQQLLHTVQARSS
jgi:hypothetical protein